MAAVLRFPIAVAKNVRRAVNERAEREHVSEPVRVAAVIEAVQALMRGNSAGLAVADGWKVIRNNSPSIRSARPDPRPAA